MRKHIVVIAILFLSMLLSACSSDAARQSNPAGASAPADEPLTVYSLFPNQLMERVVRDFYGKNVQLVVGTDGEISAQDAMRLLATEILSGAGPDVIVMDGLPIDDYAKKGAIADLRELLPEQLLPNIRAAYESEDGSVYAIPIKVKLPMLLGEDIGAVETLTDFVAYLEERDAFYFAADVVDFYTVFGNRWIEAGRLNESAFREDLEAMARIAAPLNEMGSSIAYGENHADAYSDCGASSWHAYEHVVASIGFCGSLRRLGNPYDVIPFHENARLKPFGESIFIPYCILAVNSQSQQLERAEGFVKTCLYADVQRIDTGDQNRDWDKNFGFPVNEAVFRVQIGELPDPPKGSECYPQNDGIQIQWKEPWHSRTPTYEEATNLLETLKTLTTPAPMDYVLQDIFITQIRSYLSGDSSMEEAVTAVQSKLSLYMAE